LGSGEGGIMFDLEWLVSGFPIFASVAVMALLMWMNKEISFNKPLKTIAFCVAENVLFNLVIFLVWFTYNPFRDDFINMNIHPLLIVVSLMALRYGNYLGILSAVVASITFVYAYYLLGRDLMLFAIDWEHYKFLLMFFLSAVILGTHRDKMNYTINMLKEKLKVAREEREIALSTEEKYRFINEQLKKQIFSAEESILSLYDMASALENFNPEEVYTEIMTLMTVMLKAKVVSIYTVDIRNGYLRLKIRMGDIEYSHSSIKVDDHEYLQRVVYDRQATRINHGSEDVEPIFSAPIIKDGEVIAVINLEKADFEIVTLHSFTMFKLTVQWITKALLKAIEVDNVLHGDRYHVGTRFLKMSIFDERVNVEKKRKDKFGLEYALLKFKRNGYSLGDLDRKIISLIRQVDIAGYDSSSDEVNILFPVTSSENFDKLKNRLRSKLNMDL
jgi:hypothetical protein